MDAETRQPSMITEPALEISFMPCKFSDIRIQILNTTVSYSYSIHKKKKRTKTNKKIGRSGGKKIL